MKRLAAILLTIRRQARRHLGILRMRDRKWLEEYYFLLAVYGIYAGLFESYQSNRRQIAAVYISAGVAARQLARPTQKLNEEIRGAEAMAQALIAAPHDAAERKAFTLAKDRCEMSYHARLAFAKKAIAAKKPEYLAAAVTMLEGLRTEYPHVLEIDDELALAYLEDGNSDQFEILLTNVRSRYGQLSEEFLSRIGRFWKDKGDKERAADATAARLAFQTALGWYQKAYALRSHYYPGINVAALALVLGKTELARRTAEAVLQNLDAQEHSLESGWARATHADAHLLLERHTDAERHYRHAKTLLGPRDIASMRRQVELLRAFVPVSSLMQNYWTDAKLDDVFGATD